jgi:NhaP-type Na+/H+ or K+/H+ antiporter
MLGSMLASFLLAGLFGTLGGLAWSLALSRIHGLQNSIFTTPAFVCIVFGVVELLGYSGAIASLALGITLGNLGHIPQRLLRHLPEALASLNTTERQVFSEVVFLLKTFFFVFIGISIRFGGWGETLTGLILVGALFTVRIPVVHASLRSSQASRSDAMACTAIIPKGLAAAAVASVPLQMGLPHAEALRNTTFAVVLLSILAASGLVFLNQRGWLAGFAKHVFGRFAEEGPSDQA